MSRPYQGYPYVDPLVQDAPTLDAAQASRWAHLPVRKVKQHVVLAEEIQQAKYSKGTLNPAVYKELSEQNDNPVVTERYTPYSRPKQNHRPPNTRKEKEEDAPPVVYVDLPEEQNSPVVTSRYPAYDRPNPNHRPPNTRKEKEEDAPPVVYVDLPEEQNSPVVTSRYPAYDRPNPNQRPSNKRKEKKQEEEDAPPVVYVDLPEEHNSPVVTSRYPAYDRPNTNQRPSNKRKEKKQEEEDAPPVVYVDLPEEHNSLVVTSRYPAYDRPTQNQRLPNKRKEKKQEEDDAPPVVYVDLPEEHNSPVVTSRYSAYDRPNTRPAVRKEKEEEEDAPPVVYVDLPEEHGSAVAQRTPTGHTPGQSPGSSSESKRDLDENPVVYIDIPDRYGSDISTRDAPSHHEESSFVQDTIYYDQFDNRRIDEDKQQAVDSDDDTSSIVAPPYRPAVRRPNTLALDGQGPSASHSSYASPLPSSMMKESQVYQPEAPMSSGLPDTIPVSEFPEPPPAYTEIDQASNPVITVEPERTRVILPGATSPDRPTALPTTPTSLTSPSNGEVRKVMNCQHCGERVQTLVIKENGIITHAVAVLCMLVCFVPGVAFIYCTDYLKVTNYYCPICNGVIAYNLPFMKDKINIYTT